MKPKKIKTAVQPFEFRLKALSENGTFEGYGSVFNNVDAGGDIVAPGAFLKSLNDQKIKGRKIPVLWQHDYTQPIGVYDDIHEDDYGLYVKGTLLIDDVQQSKEAYALMKAGAVTGLSIGYGIVEYTANTDTGIWTLTELDLYEISPVTFPMNDDARVDSVKNRIAGGEIPTERDFEKFLRDAGFSKKDAAIIAGHGIKTLQRDSESQGDETLELLKGFTIPSTFSN